MALPPTINNGDIPDATILMQWFLYLVAAGAGIQQGTRDQLKQTARSLSPQPFMYICSDTQTIGMFIGDLTKADQGLVDMGGWS